MEMNGYALSMSTSINAISIADVLANNLDHWYKTAKGALYSVFNRECDYQGLIHDLYCRQQKKANDGIPSAFAPTEADAEAIIGRLVAKYAQSSKYATGLEDLNAAKDANKGMEVTFCGLESFGEKLDFEEAVQTTADVDVILDVHFAKDFINKWDAMKDTEELSTDEKLKILSELAVAFSSLTSDAERTAIVNTAKSILDLGEDTPDELKKAMYTLVSM